MSCGSTTVTGKEVDLIEKGGWRGYVPDWVWDKCQCKYPAYAISDRWAEYPNREDTVNMAKTFFNLNKPKEMDGDHGQSYINNIKIFDDRNDPRSPSVLVEAQGKTKTLWLNFMNKARPDVDMSYIDAKRCAQSESFYKELNGKYVRVAEGTCE